MADAERRKSIEMALATSLFDSDIISDVNDRLQFITNDIHTGRKVFTAIENELLKCDRFYISVAFITESGITPLLQTLKQLEDRGIPGQILTTNYLSFSEPKALRKLAAFKNIELRMYYVEPGDPGFHSKGYIFQNDSYYNIIIGSSNLTQSALTRNKEWNVRLTSSGAGEYTYDIMSEFFQLWRAADSLDEWIDKYTQIYEEQRRISRQQQVPELESYRLEPNNMQVSFVQNLSKLRDAGETKALLISATGTGKTFASAFALRDQSPRRVLFLVHREQIAKQAIKSYKRVFGTTKSFGLLSGTSKDHDVDYLFSTMQMMAKASVMRTFHKEAFDIIVIDEVHRAGAESYQRIMDYFTPECWVGMTASPDRPDGFDIYGLFDHNIAYEIRLQQALAEDLLCPFHYFGITDIEIDGQVIDDETIARNFNTLVSDLRVDYILSKLDFYGYSGSRVKGLIFCSKVSEAEEISHKMNMRGLRTIALSGKDSQSEREEVIERLVTDDAPDYLDYILTVDIFNEGVDIPEINQVVMLRPTESPIVFVQQLGRGLRKADDKEYVVILDFIANYKNNFMIPLALAGDRTYNKDNIRRYVVEGGKVIPGSSTIHFDEVSKEKIFNSINNMSTTRKLLKDKYIELKFKLGRIPSILDFYKYGEIDPQLIIDYKPAGSYYRFLKTVEPEYLVQLSEAEDVLLLMISRLFASGKRPHELVILDMLRCHDLLSVDAIEEEIYVRYNIEGDRASIISAINILAGDFVNTEAERNWFTTSPIIDKFDGSVIKRNHQLYGTFKNAEVAKQYADILVLGDIIYRERFSKRDGSKNLALFEKYSRKDVCRLLNWPNDDSSTMYGYSVKHGTCPIFVTLNKSEDITKSTSYDDRFLSNKAFNWMTKNNRTLESDEVKKIIGASDEEIDIYLFSKKSDGDGTDFYYVGQVTPIVWEQTTINDDGGNARPIVNIQFEMAHIVREDIYDYLTQ